MYSKSGTMRIACLIALSLGGGVAQAVGPTVILQNGIIHGGKCAMSDSNYFLGIPYAKPPVGSLRFEPPQAFEGYFGSAGLDATTPAPSCMQFGNQGIIQGQSEDCLKLDVYIPANASKGEGLPVKVWLYGGNDEVGGVSDPLFDGCLSSGDSIVVTVNYRLGPLGFLAAKTAGLKANNGIRDQILALQWIQSNIPAFGGDSSKVMLFGQSSGAENTWVISTLPQSPSLISAAIMESGGGRYIPTVEMMQNFTQSFITTLNCSIFDTSCIRSASSTQMNDTIIALLSQMPNVPVTNSIIAQAAEGWTPVVDGDLIPIQPLQHGVQVPSILGSNTKDGNLLILDQYESQITNITQQTYNEFLTVNFGEYARNVSAAYALDQFMSEGTLAVFAAMATIMTDYNYRCTARRGLRSTRSAPVWGYMWGHQPSCSWVVGIPSSQKILRLFGPTHTAEIPFIWGLTEHLPLSTGPNETAHGGCNLTSAEKKISAFMNGAWTSMADSRQPGGTEDWPQFSNHGLGVLINETVQITNLDYTVCDFWDAIDSAMLKTELEDTESNSTISSGINKPSASSFSPTAASSSSATVGAQSSSGIQNPISQDHAVLLAIIVSVSGVLI